MKALARKRLLFGILAPVVVVGTLISYALPAALSPRLMSLLRSRSDANLTLASDLAVGICEERFGDLLDLRLEDSAEMNAASLNEALEGIRAVHQRFQDIHLLVFSEERRLLVSSNEAIPDTIVEPIIHPGQGDIQWVRIGGTPYRATHALFPFWRLRIYSVISEAAYNTPIVLAQRIVHVGAFGVLLTVLASVVVMFLWRVDRPLDAVISATRRVGEGQLTPIPTQGSDEIGQVVLAFNAMIEKLSWDRAQMHRMMAEVRDSEQQYRVLTENSLAYIALIRDGRLLYLNRTLIDAVGASAPKAVGAAFSPYVHEKDRDRVVETVASVERGDSETRHFECRIVTRAREVLWLEVLAVLVLYREQNAVLLHAVNISNRKQEAEARKRLQEKLAQAQKMEAIGTLAGGVAHDLNNILCGLVSYPELVLMDLPEDSPLREPVCAIRESGQRAADIVQDLLTLARRGVSVKKVASLNDLVSAYLRSPEHRKIMAAYPRVRVETSLAEPLFNLVGSPVHLGKSIMNLVKNAAESMPEGGPIRVATENRYLGPSVVGARTLPAGDYVVLTVADEGIGIPEDTIDRIFEPFFTKKVMGYSGTGLGMSVVWGTVEDHGGSIEVESRQHRGTTFTLYFPASRQEAEVEPDSVSMDRLVGNGERILVVDDVEEQRRLASEILGRLGYTVYSVSSGEAALHFLRESPVDLLVLDMIMGSGMDGLDTYRKAIDIVPGQKAIILSGFSETDRVKTAIQLGVDTYVKKPFVMETIASAVQSALGCPRAA